MKHTSLLTVVSDEDHLTISVIIELHPSSSLVAYYQTNFPSILSNQEESHLPSVSLNPSPSDTNSHAFQHTTAKFHLINV